MRDEARRGGEFLLGVLAGAALMYLFDPNGGSRRRALARDQVVHAGHELQHLGEAAAARGRDLRNRAQGVVAQARSRIRHEVVDDEILEARVRSRLGHHITNPGALEVRAQGGCVTLSGPVLSSEAERLLTSIAAIPGVRDLVDRLEPHEHSAGGPGLQGQLDPGAGEA